MSDLSDDPLYSRSPDSVNTVLGEDYYMCADCEEMDNSIFDRGVFSTISKPGQKCASADCK